MPSSVDFDAVPLVQAMVGAFGLVCAVIQAIEVLVLFLSWLRHRVRAVEQITGGAVSTWL